MTVNVVTGAFGFIGRHIAARLLEQGEELRTLTSQPASRDPFEGRVPALPLDFEKPERLAESMRGADVLYNTYWVRFPYGSMTFERAVANSRVLFQAARAAGVRKIVHVSITNASVQSPLGYFRGKAQVEEALRASGLSYSIVRPTLVFGEGDILVNNVAWFLRRSPAFFIAGGGYRVQPVLAEDVASLCVRLAKSDAAQEVDAVGSDTLTFENLVRQVASALGSRTYIAKTPPWMVLAASWMLGRLLGDRVLTRDELRGLMDGLLVSEGPPTCPTRFSEWITAHRDRVGNRYVSELHRHYAGRS